MHTNSAWLRKQLSAALSTPCECICNSSQTLHSEWFSAKARQACLWAEQRAWEAEKNVHSLGLWRVYCHILKDKKGKASQRLSMNEHQLHCGSQPRHSVSDILQIHRMKMWSKKASCSLHRPLHFSHLYLSAVWSRNIFPNYLNKEISIMSWINILQPGKHTSHSEQTSQVLCKH